MSVECLKKGKSLQKYVMTDDKEIEDILTNIDMDTIISIVISRCVLVDCSLYYGKLLVHTTILN